MKIKQKKILVVVAHPDDEVLGCGGIIAKHVSEGDEVHILALADGVTSRHYDPKVKRENETKRFKRLIDIRKQEFFAAIQILGVNQANCHYLGYPDQRLDAIPLLDIIKQIEAISEKIDPDKIYTHHWGDLNKDHRICYEAALTAFRPNRMIGGERSKVSIFCFETAGNMNLLAPKAVFRFAPDHNSDISRFINIKQEALAAYKSELREFPHPFSLKAVKNQAADRARRLNCKYAEAFQAINI